VDRVDLLNYAAKGYHIERKLFSANEIAERAAHYMEINRQGAHPGDFVGVPRGTGTTLPEPLAAYPRLIQMHEWDMCSAAWMNDPRLMDVAAAIMGQEPCVLQTMVYFKPPGSRGQSFHQDNLYLRTTPIVAAWTALDNCDWANGAMEMVEGSHLLGLLPCRFADTDTSFTDSETVFPAYLHKQLIDLEAGDVVFFGGLIVHGSMPNTTTDRFRRAFIVHYRGKEYFPIVGPPLPTSEAK
jgi:ectoine hydroxylase-related dioxygenase (phytanoyl-CoA dioxygenase family)